MLLYVHFLLTMVQMAIKTDQSPDISFAYFFVTAATHPLLFLSLRRREEGLVRPCSVVGEEEDMAAENPLDAGQVRHPSRRQAALHAAAQASAPAAAQHEAHEGQGQLL